MITISHERGRIAIRMTALPMGKDLCVALVGGDREHIGAAAVSQPRPSLLCDGTVSSTTSVIALLGHKEDELAKYVASKLAVGLNAVVCVACGVHVDGIEPSEVRDVLDMTRLMTQELLDELLARQ
jgi:gallate decarboxylase subunit D